MLQENEVCQSRQRHGCSLKKLNTARHTGREWVRGGKTAEAQETQQKVEHCRPTWRIDQTDRSKSFRQCKWRNCEEVPPNTACTKSYRKPARPLQCDAYRRHTITLNLVMHWLSVLNCFFFVLGRFVLDLICFVFLLVQGAMPLSCSFWVYSPLQCGIGSKFTVILTRI